MHIIREFKLCNLFICLIFLSVISADSYAKDNKKHDYEALGIAFTSAIEQRDTLAMANLFDVEAFAEKTAGYVFTRQSDIDDYKTGFLSNYPERSMFMDQIMGQLFKEQFSVKYLRVVNGRPLIRYDYALGGHEYMYLIPKKGSDETLLADDMLFLTRGKTSSKSVAEVVQMAIKPSSSVFKRLFDVKEVNTDIVESITRVVSLITESKYQQAYDLLESLPEEIKTSRFVVDTGVQLSGHINDTEYQKQLANLEKYYGDDPTTSFTLIDYHFLKQDFAKAVKAVNVLQKNLGNDGALESLIASIYFESGDLDIAKKHARKAIDIESDFEDAYWVLVNTTNAAKSYDETVAVLDMLQQNFGYQFTVEDFTVEPVYTELVASKAFNDWIKN